MANWLERARREIQKIPCRPTANTAERTLTAVTAVPHPGLCEKSAASIGSNGSTPSGDFSEIENDALHPTRWRVTLADGQTMEHSVPSALTEGEAPALSRPWGQPVQAEPVGVDPPSPPGDLGTLLTQACQGAPGIGSAAFRALLSPEDVQDIEGGHIPMVTLNAYAKSFAEGIRCGRITVLAAAIPKTTLPSRVRCGECLRFKRDTIGDGTGIGRCRVQGEGTGSRPPALWANAERECKDFAAR